jgi:hypothetical protein
MPALKIGSSTLTDGSSIYGTKIEARDAGYIAAYLLVSILLHYPL